MNQVCMELNVRAGVAPAAGSDWRHLRHLPRVGEVLARGAYAAGSTLWRGLELLALWQARARDRRELMSLSDRTLQDIGLSRGEAYREYAKPRWRQ